MKETELLQLLCSSERTYIDWLEATGLDQPCELLLRLFIVASDQDIELMARYFTINQSARKGGVEPLDNASAGRKLSSDLFGG